MDKNDNRATKPAGQENPRPNLGVNENRNTLSDDGSLPQGGMDVHRRPRGPRRSRLTIILALLGLLLILAIVFWPLIANLLGMGGTPAA